MKIEKYERPDLEELELILEGSFLDDSTGPQTDPDHPDVPIDPGEEEGDGWN